MSNQQQTPSIGRIVHFHVNSKAFKQPLAAVITQVHDADKGIVTLNVMSPFAGNYISREVRQGSGDYEWNWPPFVPPVNKPDPKPVPTTFDVALILNKHVDATPLEVHRATEEIMDLFEDFLK